MDAGLTDDEINGYIKIIQFNQMKHIMMKISHEGYHLFDLYRQMKC